jgi:Holliday junction resolvase
MTESDVRSLLKERGFSVNEKTDSTTGLDIVAVKNGHYFLIEVKKIFKEKSSYRCRVNDAPASVELVACCGDNKFIIYPVNGVSFSKYIRFMDLMDEEMFDA